MSEKDIKLEARVLEAVKTGSNRLAKIVSSTDLPEREVDRFLQRLKKAGKVSYLSTPGWHVKKEESSAVRG